jgi:hypothetical protein
MKITKEIIEQGIGSNGIYSDTQLRVFGYTENNCDDWINKIIGDEEPLWKIKLFLSLKDWEFIDKRGEKSQKSEIFPPISIETRQMLEKGMSSNGGWNKSQIMLLGEAYPLKKGWKSRIKRKEYSKGIRKMFIEMKSTPSPRW